VWGGWSREKPPKEGMVSQALDLKAYILTNGEMETFGEGGVDE
jgi:hypothetical protein